MRQHAAYIFVGPRSETIKHTEEHLKRVWCSKQGCNSCPTCTHIKAHHHHLLFWLVPEKHYYTVEQMHELAHSLSFSVVEGEHSYIVFQETEKLSSSSAHTLLKVVEEPPAGYHFIFLTESLESVLPTLTSRCIILHFEHKNTQKWETFCGFFTKPDPQAWVTFASVVEKEMPSEQETKPILETIAHYWLQEYKTAIAKEDTHKASYALSKTKSIQEMIQYPPLPGSGKMFWRTLFSRMTF